MKPSSYLIFPTSDEDMENATQILNLTNSLRDEVVAGLPTSGLCDYFSPENYSLFRNRCLVDGMGSMNVSFKTHHSSLFNFSLEQVLEILMEKDKGYLDSSTEIIFIIFYCILILFGVVGNVMVGYIIWRKKTMRTSRNLYIINLTISDLALCIGCMPFTLIGLIYKDWTLGSAICKLVPVIQGTNILVSTATIVAIAAERYVSIVRIGNSQRKKWHVAGSLFLIWASSLLFTMPLYSYYIVEQVKLGDYVLYHRCIEKWPSSKYIREAWVFMLLVSQYIFPILVLAVVHGSIKRYLSCHMTIRRDERRAQREITRNRRTTILLSTIAISFAVSWLPWHVTNLLADFNYHRFLDPRYLYTVFGSCHIIAMSTACSNPVLYGWLNTNLRRELLEYVPDFLKLKMLLPKKLRGPTIAGAKNSARTPIVKAESITLNAYQEQNEQTQNIDDQQVTTAVSVDDVL